MSFPGSQWAGHCNGFAAAALLEPEPTEPRDVLGVTFSVGDQKGLLTDYHFGDATAWVFGEESGAGVTPADFHHVLLAWLGAKQGARGFVVTFDMGGGEVWSFPAYRFESEWGPDATPNVWRVRTTVWMADMNVPPNFVGTRPYPGPQGMSFEYTLEGDPRSPSGGSWTGKSVSGRFAHPGRVWYPDPSTRNLERPLTSPGLDRDLVASILGESQGAHLLTFVSRLRLSD
jgi:hypothetical protein